MTPRSISPSQTFFLCPLWLCLTGCFGCLTNRWNLACPEWNSQCFPTHAPTHLPHLDEYLPPSGSDLKPERCLWFLCLLPYAVSKDCRSLRCSPSLLLPPWCMPRPFLAWMITWPSDWPLLFSAIYTVARVVSLNPSYPSWIITYHIQASKYHMYPKNMYN